MLNAERTQMLFAKETYYTHMYEATQTLKGREPEQLRHEEK